MRTVLVTIDNLNGSVDLELPLDVPIGELLPLLSVACSAPLAGVPRIGGPPLALGTSEGEAFATERTLAACGVVDGMRLLLREAAALRRPTSTTGMSPLPTDVPSSAQTGGIGISWSRDI